MEGMYSTVLSQPGQLSLEIALLLAVRTLCSVPMIWRCSLIEKLSLWIVAVQYQYQ